MHVIGEENKNMENTLSSAYRKYGIRGAVHFLFQKLGGVAGLEEEISTLRYMLNAYCDIKSFPKATGALRQVQIGDATLLSIVDKVLSQNKIDYWLDRGTLLGAVRHGGFIPWDDDMDIAMMRDDYERAYPVLVSSLEPYGIQVGEYSGRIGIGYHHRNTGIWIDVFPCEWVIETVFDAERNSSWDSKVIRYAKKWSRRCSDTSGDKLYSLKKTTFPFICDRENASAIMYPPEWHSVLRAWNRDDIYPLSKLEFEDYRFNVPNDFKSYLAKMYGESYMGFPKNGMEHHGDERGKLSDWSKMTGTDMDKEIEDLKEILSLITG